MAEGMANPMSSPRCGARLKGARLKGGGNELQICSRLSRRHKKPPRRPPPVAADAPGPETWRMDRRCLILLSLWCSLSLSRSLSLSIFVSPSLCLYVSPSLPLSLCFCISLVPVAKPCEVWAGFLVPRGGGHFLALFPALSSSSPDPAAVLPVAVVTLSVSAALIVQIYQCSASWRPMCD